MENKEKRRAVTEILMRHGPLWAGAICSIADVESDVDLGDPSGVLSTCYGMIKDGLLVFSSRSKIREAAMSVVADIRGGRKTGRSVTTVFEIKRGSRRSFNTTKSQGEAFAAKIAELAGDMSLRQMSKLASVHSTMEMRAVQYSWSWAQRTRSGIRRRVSADEISDLSYALSPSDTERASAINGELLEILGGRVH